MAVPAGNAVAQNFAHDGLQLSELVHVGAVAVAVRRIDGGARPWLFGRAGAGRLRMTSPAR
jgi:hypothetical protein